MRSLPVAVLAALVLITVAPAPAAATPVLPGNLASTATGGTGPLSVLSAGAEPVLSAALGVFAAGVLTGAGSALRETAHVISHTTAPRLRSTWFSSTYWRVAGLAALLTLPFLCAAAVQALLRADAPLLARSVFGYLPLAVIGVNLAAPLTMLLLAATDEMSSVVAGAGMGGGVHFLDQTAVLVTGLSALDGSPFLGIAVGLLTLAAAVALAVEMLIREAAVYVVVLMLPLALAALIWPARRIWAVRLGELLIALILSKFVIVAVLSLAGAAYGASGSPTVTRLLTAMTLVMLSTFAPWVMLRLLPFTELAAGAAGAIRSELARPAQLPRQAAKAAHDVADWVESLPGLLRRQAAQPESDDSASGSSMLSTAGASTAGASTPVARLASSPVANGSEPVRTDDGKTSHTTTRSADRQRLPGMERRWQAEDFGWEEIRLDGDGLSGWAEPNSALDRLPPDTESDAPE